MLIDKYKKIDNKIVKKSLLQKYLEKTEEINDLNRYVMPDDMKEKIHNIMASKNVQIQRER